MIVSKMVKYSRTLLVLLIVVVISGLLMGLKPTPSPESRALDAPAGESDSGLSVTCIPFGIYGDITMPSIVGRLSDSGDNLTFVGATNGLYVIAADGKLQHFLYSPFGIKHVALIDDITSDGIREVVVALNDTQVPALRCYDGATWEKVWQFAPMAKIWDKLWVERQIIITRLEVIDDGGSQRVVISSGRSVFSVDAKEGTKQWQFTASSAVWRMVTLADVNGDDASEAFVGSDDGHLFWLNVSTGKVLWQTKLSKHKGVDYNYVQHLVSDIVVLDKESGLVAVASADGWAQMYDLSNKRREWDTLVFEIAQADYYSPSESEALLLSPTTDTTGDGLPELLLTKIPSNSQYSYTAYTDGKAALCDSTGNILWEKDAIACSNMGVETGSFEGKPVFLQRETGEISLVNLKDGESVLHTIPLSVAIDPGLVVWQPGGDGYLTFSSAGDLAAISAKGDLLWYYPRIANVKADAGCFVGDATEDTLFWAESAAQQSSSGSPVQNISQAESRSMTSTTASDSPQNQTLEVRLLMMMDGTTKSIAWSYEMPYSEFKNNGGLKGIRVTPDLVGSDNVPDIIGYRQDTVFIFSGKDAAFSTFPAGQPIASLDVIRNGPYGKAIAVGITGGLMIFDSAGTLLWTTTSTEWLADESNGQSPGTVPGFMMLDDVNSDNISDLAVASPAKIVVLKSVAATDNYELHLTFKPEAGYSISRTEIVPDENRDGVRDLIYFQYAQASQQGERTLCPLLCQRSPVDGKELFKVNPPSGIMAYDLACGDFNGDGYADSLFSTYEGNTCGADASSQPERIAGKVYLWILSGKDGATLWMHPINENDLYGGPPGNKLPVINVGDADGDGADDLAYRFAPRGKSTYRSSGSGFTSSQNQQLGLDIYSIAQDSMVRSIPTTPLMSMGYISEQYAIVPADVDIDGHTGVITEVREPSVPSYDPDAYGRYYPGGSSPQPLALVDIASGRRLAGFTGFDAETISLFESHQPGILGVAGCGGACFLHINSDLQITSPEEGAKTNPIVGVEWDGPTDGEFSQVFVDGVRNDVSSSLESELFLARGTHHIVVWSIDDCGRICYSPSDLNAPLTIKVTPSPWKPVWLVLSLFVLLAAVLLLSTPRLHRALRARRRTARS